MPPHFRLVPHRLIRSGDGTDEVLTETRLKCSDFAALVGTNSLLVYKQQYLRFGRLSLIIALEMFYHTASKAA